LSKWQQFKALNPATSQLERNRETIEPRTRNPSWWIEKEIPLAVNDDPGAHFFIASGAVGVLADYGCRSEADKPLTKLPLPRCWIRVVFSSRM
jgi:hypothetical protein